MYRALFLRYANVYASSPRPQDTDMHLSSIHFDLNTLNLYFDLFHATFNRQQKILKTSAAGRTDICLQAL